MRTVLILIFLLNSGIVHADLACRPNSKIISKSEGAYVEKIVGPEQEVTFKLRFPQKIDDFELTVAELVIGTFDEPIIVFDLKLHIKNKEFESSFTNYKNLSPVFINLAYGGKCDGVHIWQEL